MKIFFYFKPIKEIGAELNKLNYRKPTDYSDRMCPLFLHTDAAQAIGKIKGLFNY
jgi:hypothetical protein